MYRVFSSSSIQGQLAPGSEFAPIADMKGLNGDITIAFLSRCGGCVARGSGGIPGGGACRARRRGYADGLYTLFHTEHTTLISAIFQECKEQKADHTIILVRAQFFRQRTPDTDG